MAKRRNVIIGLGTLAVGSGAFLSSAIADTFTDPTADFRVIADAQLRVRAARNNSDVIEVDTDGGNVSVVGELTDTSTFFNDASDVATPGRPDVREAEILENEVNNELAVQFALSLRQDGTFDPLIEIVNDSDTPFDVGINYAETDGDGNIVNPNGETDGYGSQVNKTDGEFDQFDSSGVSRELVQEVYQFFTTNSGDSDVGSGIPDGDLISPDPSDAAANNADEAANTIEIGSGESANIKLVFNTTTDVVLNESSIPGQINSVAGGTSFDDNEAVDLLDAIFVTADDATEE